MNNPDATAWRSLEGKIILKSLTQMDPERLILVEQYINDQLAKELYERFEVGMRVHL